MADHRQQALERIRANIENHGHHVYMIAGREHPQFTYSIGLSRPHGAELLLAGGTYFRARDTGTILNEIARSGTMRAGTTVHTTFGDFALRHADPSWADRLMLGALDYYDADHVAALQIVPPDACRTIDVPDLSRPFDPALEPVWHCLTEPWPFAVSQDSQAVTNLQALQGAPITEGLRRREEVWEMFAGADPDVPQQGVIIVPLGTLLLSDPSLRPFAQLAVGAGLKRDARGAWIPR